MPIALRRHPKPAGGKSPKTAGAASLVALGVPGVLVSAMDRTKTPIERAFELARSGKYLTASEVKRAVSAEGYAVAQIEGPLLMRQLRALIRDARAKSPT